MKSQLDYYIDNQDELVKKYNGKIIALKDGECEGVYGSKTAALKSMLAAGHEPGTFMIILCTPGDGQYTATFHSNVSFDQVALK
ncbi:MAG: hypothetical protein LBF58_09335 [Deltaproteobacteria bacterium]|jgi:hypothetical protein|nr:hypothetical protein [Deltaproteobacteria bacterium]